MLVRFGGRAQRRGLVVDIQKDEDGVFFRCLGGNTAHGTKRQALALAKALTSAVEGDKGKEDRTGS